MQQNSWDKFLDMDVLREIGLLDGESETFFDHIAHLVARALNCQISLLSIIDHQQNRQFFKASYGLSPEIESSRQTPLSHSFCKTVVDHGVNVHVSDARNDTLFQDNPAIDELGVVAYLGVPVVDASGTAVGSLCAISPSPRVWADDDLKVLQTLADAVSGEIKSRVTALELRVLNSELRTTQKRFSDLAANVPGAIFRYILFADGNDMVEYMSPGCVDIWELAPADIETDPTRLWDIIVPEDINDMRSSISRSAAFMDLWKHRWRVVTKSGKQKWLQGYATPEPLADGAIVWNTLILDVTVEVEALEKQRLTERLIAETQKQKTVGQLVGGLAHDLNNLLAVIMGNAEVAIGRRDVEPLDPYLNDIVKAAERGSGILQSVLSFSRQSDLRPVVLNLNEVLQKIEGMIRHTVSENIDIIVAKRMDTWFVKADRGRLEDAILNLVLNARDAMPNGGKLTIEMSNMELDDDFIARRGEDIASGRYVMLSVSDTGTGIEPSVLESIFEPFMTTKLKGTGLGLSMALGFSKQSGGTMRVYTELGHGSSFQIYLPAIVSSTADNTLQPLDKFNRSDARVLLVEDNDDVRNTVRLLLESSGYVVTEAASGDKALEMLDDGCSEFDVVLTDVVMPGKLQGPDLVHVIRGRRPDMPVVFMSGYPHEANVHGNGIRPNDISLNKPMSKVKLLTALEKALQVNGQN